MRLMVRTPTGRNYAYYRCASRATESRCALPTMNATWLDGELFNAIREAIDQPKLWRDAVSAALHQRPAELQKSIAQLREEIAKDERALKRAYQHMVESDDPRDRQLYLDERAERRARIAGAESKIYELEGLLRAMTAKTIEDFADRQRQAFRKATSLDEKARLIRPIVYKIVVDPAGDSAKIFLVRHPAAEGSAVHNPLVRKLGDPFQWRIQFSHSDSRHNPTPDGGLIALLVKLGPRPNFGRPPDWRLRRAWRQRGGGKP
jgi:hypothetical protein